MKRIGILGGTFDPIHLGHIQPAINTAEFLNLKQIALLPAHIPPHKKQTTATAKHRKAMVELVCQAYDLFSLDERELHKDSPSYTVETLQAIKNEHSNSQVFFIIGMDSLLNFTSWHRWQDILTLCHLVVNTRPEHDLTNASPETLALINKHQMTLQEIETQSAGGIIIRNDESWQISSTEIRAQLKHSPSKFDTNKQMLCQDVYHYINEHQLYR